MIAARPPRDLPVAGPLKHERWVHRGQLTIRVLAVVIACVLILAYQVLLYSLKVPVCFLLLLASGRERQTRRKHYKPNQGLRDAAWNLWWVGSRHTLSGQLGSVWKATECIRTDYIQVTTEDDIIYRWLAFGDDGLAMITRSDDKGGTWIKDARDGETSIQALNRLTTQFDTAVVTRCTYREAWK